MEKRSRVIKLGLRGKLVLSMIVVGVFPVALVTFISYFQGNQFIERVIGSSFQALAHQSAGNIESIVLNEVTRLSALSKSPEIVRAVQNHEADAEVLPTLAAFLKENSASTKSLGLYLIDLKGNLVSSVSSRPESLQGIKGNSKVPDLNADVHISDLFKDPGMDSYAFKILVSVKDSSEQTIGFLQQAFSAKDYFSPLLDPIRFGEMGHLMLIDSSGVVIACPIFPTGHKMSSPELIRTIVSQQPGWAETTDDGHGLKEASIVGFSPLVAINEILSVSSTNLWHTFAWQSSEELFSERNQLMNWIISAGVFSTFMIVFMGVFASGRITRPIAKLREATEKMGRGEAPAEVLLDSGDEISDLANSFNKMSRDLQATRLSEHKHFNELRTTLDKLKQSRTHNQAILENAVDGIIMIDEQGTVEMFNPAAEKLFGYFPDEAIGKNVRMLMPEPYAAEHDAYVKKYLSTGKANIIGIGREVIARRKNGSEFPMDLSVGEIWVEDSRRFVGIMRDISQRKTMEAQLEKLSQAVEQSPSPVLITDKNGVIEYANPCFLKTTGYSKEEVLGKTPRIIKSEEHPPEFYEDLWQTITQGREWVGEFCNRKKNGELYWEKQSIAPIRDGDGNLTHFLAVTIDDTGRKRAEEKLRKYAAELEQANEVLNDFTSVASHDMQEPLRKILMFGDRLKDHASSRLDDQDKVYLDKIQKSAHRMKNFINDLLIYGKISSPAISFESTDLNLVVAEVVDDLELLIEQVSGKVEIEGKLPLVISDRLQMKQLWQNLISNALKYSREGEAVRIQIRHRRVGGMWEFEVEDNGMGFDVKYMDRITKPFQRLHSKSDIEGTGIGLAICQKIITQHGGTLTAKSTPGKGSTFIFQLTAKL